MGEGDGGGEVRPLALTVTSPQHEKRTAADPAGEPPLEEATMSVSQPRTVGILIFDDVEVLDFCGPFEVFSVARPTGEHSDDARLFHAITIAEENRIITCRGGLIVKPHYTIDNHPPLDILVVPGGQGTRRE